MSSMIICTHCGTEIEKSEKYVVNQAVLCADCADNLTFVCECCGRRFYNENNCGENGLELCERCRDEYYTCCEECGRWIPLDVAYENTLNPGLYFCEYCHNRMVERFSEIHPYSYKPTPIFYGKATRFFGVELEIDRGGNSYENAGSILSIVNRDDPCAYIKNDSSLNDGMEIVTHPMSLQYHLEKMPWSKMMQKALSLGYYSHKTSTCGLHIHVNRNTFGEEIYEQDMAISHILYFIEHHWAEMLKFSRRTQEQLNHWAARYGYKDRPEEILRAAKKGECGRYACVNIMNRDTIEFRIFRGTLKYNTLVAALQLVNEICDAAIFMSDEELSALSWSDFVGRLSPKRVPELITYLKERQLYINEPIDTEEDN